MARCEVCGNEYDKSFEVTAAGDADAIEQRQDVAPGERTGGVSRNIEVPEADAIEQAIEVPDDDRHII